MKKTYISTNALLITPDILEILKQQYILKQIEAAGAEELYRDTLLRYQQNNCKFKSGDIIIVNWAEGAREYKVDELAWYYFCDYPVIHVNKKLRSGKFSKSRMQLQSTSEYLPYDSSLIVIKERP